VILHVAPILNILSSAYVLFVTQYTNPSHADNQ